MASVHKKASTLTNTAKGRIEKKSETVQPLEPDSALPEVKLPHEKAVKAWESLVAQLVGQKAVPTAESAKQVKEAFDKTEDPEDLHEKGDCRSGSAQARAAGLQGRRSGEVPQQLAGERNMRLNVFVMTLRHSRMLYAEFTLKQDMDISSSATATPSSTSGACRSDENRDVTG